jgi:hypothetical protein
MLTAAVMHTAIVNNAFFILICILSPLFTRQSYGFCCNYPNKMIEKRKIKRNAAPHQMA